MGPSIQLQSVLPQPVVAPVATPAAIPNPAPAPADAPNSALAKNLLLAGAGSMVINRSIGITRILAKLPEAYRARIYPSENMIRPFHVLSNLPVIGDTAFVNLAFAPHIGNHYVGRVPRTLLDAVFGASAHTIDPHAPPVATAASLGHSFTSFDRAAMSANTIGGLVVLALTVPIAYSNVHVGLREDGLRGLYDTKRGRTGVAFGIGATASLSITGRSGFHAWQAEHTLSAAVKGALYGAEVLKPWAIGLSLACGVLAAANEFGMFSRLDRQPVTPA